MVLMMKDGSSLRPRRTKDQMPAATATIIR
jgi:hypothetical protein